MAGVSLADEFDIEVKKDIDKINSLVIKFHADLKKAAPVATVATSGYNGGDFRDSWEMIKHDDLTWTIRNGQDYASILWAGRHAGKARRAPWKNNDRFSFSSGGSFSGARTFKRAMYGSTQWPEGGEPMLLKFRYKLENL